MFSLQCFCGAAGFLHLSRKEFRMKTLLCFNIIEEEKKKALRLLSLRLGLDCREVPASLQGCTIADLLTGGAPQTPLFSKPFAEEMLVMSGLSGSELNMLLDGLRQNRQRVRLKAMVTETNRSWTALRLCLELLEEERAFLKLRQNTQH